MSGKPLTFPEAPEGITDTTSRTLCKTFEQYVYLYEVMAQLTRLAYCDSGIIKEVFDSTFGQSNEKVMQTILRLDLQYGRRERFVPLRKQRQESVAPGIPHESYALGPAPDTTTHKYGTYIATNEVLTAFVIDTTVAEGILKKKGPFKDTDVIISFKGTNTFKEAVHDIKSAFMRIDLKDVAETLGFTVPNEDRDSFINGSFTKILIDAWDILIQGVTEHGGKGEFRLFCTGHSLGGAYCTLFGFILGYLKNLPSDDSPTVQLLKRIQSIHIISLGAPTLCADKARNVFNRSLISKFITFDRLVTQKVPTLTVQPYGTDIVPLVPAGFSHPGFKQAATDFQQDKKRAYKWVTLHNIYGKGSPRVYKPYEPTIEEKTALQAAEKEGTAAVKANAALETPPRALVKNVDTGVREDEDPKTPETPETPETSKTSNNPKGGRRKTRRKTSRKTRCKRWYRKTQRGGFLWIGREKGKYSKDALAYSSNFISLPTNGVLGTLIPHIVYFGMAYLTSLRTPGMKNPVPPNVPKCAYFGFYNDPKAGVLIKYVDCKGRKINTRPLRNTRIQRAFPMESRANIDATMNYLSSASLLDLQKKMNKNTRKRLNGPFLGGSKTRRADF